MTKELALDKFEDFISGLQKRMEVIDSARKGGAEVKTPNFIEEFRKFVESLFDEGKAEEK